MHVSTCKTGKEIWDKLCITYEGTNEVKQSRLNILLHDYELFRMKPHESISDMYTRFTQIVTSLHALGKELSNYEKVNKILRCLPSSYDAKITAITESKDLNTYSIDNLLGSLIAYEQGVNQRNLDAGEKKKEKTIALKAHKSDSESSESESDDVAFITRQFKSFLRKKQKHHQSWRKGKDHKYVKHYRKNGKYRRFSPAVYRPSVLPTAPPAVKPSDSNDGQIGGLATIHRRYYRRSKPPVISGFVPAVQTAGKPPDINDDFLRARESRQSTGEGSSSGSAHTSEYQTWSEVVGGRQRGRVYSMGSQAFAIEGSSYTSAFHNPSGAEESVSERVAALTREIEEMKRVQAREIEEMRKAQNEMQAELQSYRAGKQRKKDQQEQPSADSEDTDDD
ncbi:hypothetical protein KFK09_023916 [Dendrobium nobile]|uniref:Uncharacterized protein n=1 Tax=Dendrobium nobile TaxID=94219 RepID=A0A8T3ACK1_DENNO|nr:hypothetical protein KFK09_023916 [Dendrobium nobile]